MTEREACRLFELECSSRGRQDPAPQPLLELDHILVESWRRILGLASHDAALTQKTDKPARSPHVFLEYDFHSTNAGTATAMPRKTTHDGLVDIADRKLFPDEPAGEVASRPLVVAHRQAGMSQRPEMVR
ncbi:hypothetical protein [Bradyrhizobium iriomotense]|uniref:hypothetical protein n=1 Tax=Bradyrhizobium iriomotense TaxID=441950 RepID=UPI0024E10451|nr:hypothetical protein [Bradyrhizobium iriomotense]